MADPGKELSATLEYNTDLFDRTTIRRMLGHFQTLLSAILANPDEKISRLEILSDEEKRQLAQWNNTHRHYSQDQTIHQMFEAQVVYAPESVAVVSGEKPLTYRELNERANRLAHYLKKHGVGPETLWGFVSSDLWKWSSRCSVFSRPAAPICRSTPNIPESV